jgi:hypothetical protein
MAINQTMTPVLNEEWTRSTAAVPAAIAPHPPLLSGPGRFPLAKPTRKSVGLALVLSVLFGPIGLLYVSINVGLAATAVSAATLVIAGAGAVPLLVIWPLAVLGSVWGAGRERARG